MKRKIVIPIVLVGFAVGYVAASEFAPKLSRPERIVEIFEKICLPNHYGALDIPPSQLGLTGSKGMDGETRWIDRKTGVVLELTKTGCSIETHAPNALSETEAVELLGYVEAIVAKEFPELPYDPNAKMGSVSKGWLTGPVASRERWGVFLFAYPEWGDNAGSTLSINAPRK